MKRIVSIGLGILIALASFVLVPAQDVPKTLRLSGLVVKPISMPRPEYPAEAKAAEVGGTVLVKIVVDPYGSVVSARASEHGTINATPAARQKPEVTPALLALVKASEKAAREAKFMPTLRDGVAVEVSGHVIYEFVPGVPPWICDNRVLNGQAMTMPKPVYPDRAKSVRASGTVGVVVNVDEKGNVTPTIAVWGHELLKPAAIEAARKAKLWTWTLDGIPMTRGGVLIYEFEAPDEN